MRRRVDGKYWTENEDKLIQILLNKETPIKDFNRVYHKLLPVLRYMVKVIQRKYFGSYSNKLTEDVISDTITNLIMKGKLTEGKTNYYAYVGTAFKHYLFDVFVNPEIYDVRRVKIDDNYDINEDEWIADNYSVNADDMLDTIKDREEKLNKVNNFVDSHIDELSNRLVKIKRDNLSLAKETEINLVEIEWLKHARNYINNNFNEGHISALGLADYMFVAMPDILPYKLQRISYKYFGVGSDGTIIDNRKYTRDDNLHENPDFSYIQDDYTPLEVNNVKNRRNMKKRMKNKIDKLYHYF